ncbi:hypothetical protein GCM10023093_25220 [Nemorincola caseinilytica]|uniref:Uncharacterized protein n=1 Tax=Nemorincola caseinilytica TaxID=2054315 RepID=A0ABP8NJU5_9BACT
MTKAAFLLLTIIMASFAWYGTGTTASRTLAPGKAKRIRIIMLLSLTGWLAYVSAISLAGILQTASLPPRIPLLLILPLFSFMFWFVSRKRSQAFITAIPAAWLVYAQSFRIVVELLLHALYKQGMLPRMGTFEGYNFEIVIGITALLVGYLGYSRKVLPRSILLLWNCAGLLTLAIVVFIFVSHAYAPGIYAHPEPLSITDFGAFPFTLLAGFLMPLAVFMHVLSIRKLLHTPA